MMAVTSARRKVRTTKCRSGFRIVDKQEPDQEEQGSGTVLAMAMVLLTWVGFLVVVILGSWVWYAHVAANTADLAALSGAHALVDGANACGTAEDIALGSGAELTMCRVESNDVGEFLVTVRVAIPARPSVPGLLEEVVGQASAGMLEAE